MMVGRLLLVVGSRYGKHSSCVVKFIKIYVDGYCWRVGAESVGVTVTGSVL